MLEDLISPGNSWVSCHGLVMGFPEVFRGVMTLDWVSKACNDNRNIHCLENSLIESTGGCDALYERLSGL